MQPRTKQASLTTRVARLFFKDAGTSRIPLNSRQTLFQVLQETIRQFRFAKQLKSKGSREAASHETPADIQRCQ